MLGLDLQRLSCALLCPTEATFGQVDVPQLDNDVRVVRIETERSLEKSDGFALPVLQAVELGQRGEVSGLVRLESDRLFHVCARLLELPAREQNMAHRTVGDG